MSTERTPTPKPNTFSQAEFLQAASGEIGVAAEELSRRTEPTPNEDQTDLETLAHRQIVAAAEVDANSPEAQSLKALTEALLRRPELTKWPIQMTPTGSDFEHEVQIVSQAVAEAATEIGGISISEAEAFCRDGLEEFAKGVEPDDLEYMLGTVLTRIAAEAMKNSSDEVILDIPAIFTGEHSIDGIGVNLDQGTLVINGDIGRFVATGAKGVAHIIVQGNVEGQAGDQMSGEAMLEIIGNAGDGVGYDASGEARIKVKGNAGSFVGQKVHGSAKIEIAGNVQDFVGVDSYERAEILVGGNAGENVGQGAHSQAHINVTGRIAGLGSNITDEVVIEVGDWEDRSLTLLYNESFNGTIRVAGQQIEPEIHRINLP